MPVLTSSKHEKFAQLAASGVSATKAYVSAGYSKANARQNASRLITNDNVLARIKELQTAVAERVVASEIRRRNWRVEVLQQRVEGMLALIGAVRRRHRRWACEPQQIPSAGTWIWPSDRLRAGLDLILDQRGADMDVLVEPGPSRQGNANQPG
jgi:Terminase small subunit